MVPASASRAPESFYGKNRPLLFAAWPEWDMLGRGQTKRRFDDDMPGGLNDAVFRSPAPVAVTAAVCRQGHADDKALAREAAMDVNKITWAQAGHVTDPDRYMFRFGWLTITADDLAVWQAYPNAAFTLISTTAPPPTEGEEQPPGEEFRLGIFELPIDPSTSDRDK
jgi:hypothetical protein